MADGGRDEPGLGSIEAGEATIFCRAAGRLTSPAAIVLLIARLGSPWGSSSTSALRLVDRLRFRDILELEVEPCLSRFFTPPKIPPNGVAGVSRGRGVLGNADVVYEPEPSAWRSPGRIVLMEPVADIPLSSVSTGRPPGPR